MFTYKLIFGIVLFGAVEAFGPPVRPNVTTCEEFERGARFSPYELVDSMWKIFYFWSNNTELYPVIFSLASRKRTQEFKEIFELIYPDMDLEWHRSTFFMDPRPGVQILFIYGGTPGAYNAVIKREQRNTVRPHPEPLVSFAHVRMKIVDRVLGMICCEDLTAFAFARVDEMPPTQEKCLEAAGKIGYHAPEGLSYLELTKLLEEKDKAKEL